jgi:hypothetical protein
VPKYQILAGLAAAALTLTSPSGADHIVLVSEAESFENGQVLEDPLDVTLASGERLVLLSDRGDVLEINGPFAGRPNVLATDNFDVTDALARLIDNPDHVYARLGGTRTASTAVHARPEGVAWHLDPFASGGQCTVQDMTPVFRRPDTTGTLQLVLQRPGSAGSGKIEWATGAAEAQWPAEIPLRDDDLYVVRREGWVDGTLFRLAILPAPVRENLTSAIAWLAVHGCKAQAQALMRELADQRAGRAEP